MDTDDERCESSGFAPLAEADDAAQVRIDDAGQLIAALPAIFRFVPTRSLVVALICPSADSTTPARAIPAVVRFGLDAITDPAGIEETVAQLEAICHRANATATVAVVVDDRPRAALTARLAVDLLQSAEVKLIGAWLVPTIAAGASYRSLLDGDTDGIVNDPATSPLACVQALDGVQIHSSRHELADLIAVDPTAAAALTPLIDPAVQRYRAELAAAVAADCGTAFQSDTAKAVLELIAVGCESGCTPKDLATAVAALRDVMIRDVMLGLTGTGWAPSAQILWQSVARASTGRDRAEAAMLCGYDAYHRGDAVYARICLEEALRADSEHAMAVVLNTALDNGERPARIAMIAHAGRGVAAGMGIDLTATA
ncbi:DUF4192 domain-containing protein [Nocardia sp. NPDC058379]|uniref:DUF4192 domain-containing protein n=1 Tax=unclassified Nocardia TaxID=2637762 RepID=UPI00365E27BE